ncbi:MAG: Uma2 family endonuclease [Actinomycetota bacterium]|nr:Uma2 family endonuclease [Actinomycetota bacterium]
MASSEAPPLTPHRFTRQEFVRLVEHGVLGDELEVELLDGVIVPVSRESPEHAALVQVLTQLLAPVAAAGLLRVSGPVAAGDWSLPRPDLAVVPPADPTDHPSDVALAIEVVVAAKTAARYKIGVYGAARVTEYWIVDVPGRSVEVFTEPGPRGYGRHEPRRGSDLLALPAFGVAFEAAELFARAGLLPSEG